MKWSVFAVLCLLFLLSACAARLDPRDIYDQPQKPLPERIILEPLSSNTTEPAQEDVINLSIPLNASFASSYGVSENASSRSLRLLSCDPVRRAVVFNITNTDKTAWSLEPHASELIVHLRFNNYPLNEVPYWDVETGARLFGHATLGELCGGSRLEPGESLTCTLSPVPLSSLNRLALNGVGRSEGIGFSC